VLQRRKKPSENISSRTKVRPGQPAIPCNTILLLELSNKQQEFVYGTGQIMLNQDIKVDTDYKLQKVKITEKIALKSQLQINIHYAFINQPSIKPVLNKTKVFFDLPILQSKIFLLRLIYKKKE